MNESAAKTQMCPILEARSHNRKGGSAPQTCRGSVCHLWISKTPKGPHSKVESGHCTLRGQD